MILSFSYFISYWPAVFGEETIILCEVLHVIGMLYIIRESRSYIIMGNYVLGTWYLDEKTHILQ